LIYF
jgi:hypothetical protein